MTTRIIGRHQTDVPCPICGKHVVLITAAVDSDRQRDLKRLQYPECRGQDGRNHVPHQWEFPPQN
jgi:ssDNA-binding Zn-finger/Zn-ribbon topoisomerase 1